MRFLVLVLFGIWCLGFGASVSAEIGQAGQDIAILKAGVGARPLGMGGAFTAMADDADSPSWNPGGLGFVDKAEITTSQTRLSTDADHYYVSYVNPTEWGTVGISWIQIGLGSLVNTSSEVNTNNEVVDLGVFSYFSNAYLVSYGKKVNDNVSLGLTAKYLSSDMSQISNGSASGYSVTPGVLVKLKNGWRLGAKLSEAINSQSWSTGTTEQVPPKFSVGLASAKALAGVFAFDVSQIIREGYAMEGCLGYEWAKESLAFRGGYGTDGLSAGAGFLSGHTRVDYAFTRQASFSNSTVHRVSVSGVW